MRRKQHRAFQVSMTVLSLYTFLCLSLVLVLALVPVYRLGAWVLDIPSSSGLSMEVIMRNYRVLIRYLFLFGPKELVFPDLASSPSGLVHFQEVRSIVQMIQWSAIFCLPVFHLGLRHSKRIRCFGWIRWTWIFGIMFLLGTGAAVLFDPTQAFILLHKLIFTNSYWWFRPEKDPVINILTGEIFAGAGAETAFLFLIMLFRLVLFERKYRRKPLSKGKR